jgi:protein-disulfide isomerase/uncharacterized membrane protein
MSHSTASNYTPLKKTPIQLYLIAAISVIGIGISIALTQHFYDLRSGTAGFKSYCNVNEMMNCDQVAASPFSELFLGLPLSSFGAGWFLAIFFTSILALNAYWRRESTRALFALTGFASLISIFYVWVMMAKLKTFCLLCLGVDAANWISFLLVLSLKPEGFSEHKLDASKWKIFLSLTGFSLFAGVLGLRSLEGVSYKSADIQELTNTVLNSAPVSVRTGEEFPSMGPKDAPITIVEFSDFQCPYCRVGALTVNAVMKRFPGKVRVVFRNFPLDQACNPLVQHTPHPVACEAARASICAHRQGKFEPVYEAFFDQQSAFSNTHPTEMAKKAGLNPDQLQSCMSSSDSGIAITKDIEEGKLLGINSTPTFFINGHKMEGPYPIPVWTEVIETLLKK